MQHTAKSLEPGGWERLVVPLHMLVRHVRNCTDRRIGEVDALHKDWSVTITAWRATPKDGEAPEAAVDVCEAAARPQSEELKRKHCNCLQGSARQPGVKLRKTPWERRSRGYSRMFSEGGEHPELLKSFWKFPDFDLIARFESALSRLGRAHPPSLHIDWSRSEDEGGPQDHPVSLLRNPCVSLASRLHRSRPLRLWNESHAHSQLRLP